MADKGELELLKSGDVPKKDEDLAEASGLAANEKGEEQKKDDDEV